jgi:hypothetical protein
VPDSLLTEAADGAKRVRAQHTEPHEAGSPALLVMWMYASLLLHRGLVARLRDDAALAETADRSWLDHTSAA